MEFIHKFSLTSYSSIPVWMLEKYNNDTAILWRTQQSACHQCMHKAEILLTSNLWLTKLVQNSLIRSFSLFGVDSTSRNQIHLSRLLSHQTMVLSLLLSLSNGQWSNHVPKNRLVSSDYTWYALHFCNRYLKRKLARYTYLSNVFAHFPTEK